MTTDERKWAAWLAGTLAAFTVLEVKALKARVHDKPSGTLTATMRRWMGVHPKARRRYVLGPGFAGFCVYLFTHFLLGWFNA